MPNVTRCVVELIIFIQDKYEIITIINKKTVTLFEISFVFGWLFGGGCVERLDEIKQLSKSYGVAFQIMDDFEDLNQDKLTGTNGNYVLAHGTSAAMAEFDREISVFYKLLQQLGLASTELQMLAEFLVKKNSAEWKTFEMTPILQNIEKTQQCP